MISQLTSPVTLSQLTYSSGLTYGFIRISYSHYQKTKTLPAASITLPLIFLITLLGFTTSYLPNQSQLSLLALITIYLIWVNTTKQSYLPQINTSNYLMLIIIFSYLIYFLFPQLHLVSPDSTFSLLLPASFYLFLSIYALLTKHPGLILFFYITINTVISLSLLSLTLINSTKSADPSTLGFITPIFTNFFIASYLAILPLQTIYAFYIGNSLSSNKNIGKMIKEQQFISTQIIDLSIPNSREENPLFILLITLIVSHLLTGSPTFTIVLGLLASDIFSFRQKPKTA